MGLPGATMGGFCFQYDKALARALVFQMMRGTHSGDTGTHDQNVEMFHCIHRLTSRSSLQLRGGD
jgi:hypothetical protein